MLDMIVNANVVDLHVAVCLSIVDNHRKGNFSL